MRKVALLFARRYDIILLDICSDFPVLIDFDAALLELGEHLVFAALVIVEHLDLINEVITLSEGSCFHHSSHLFTTVCATDLPLVTRLIHFVNNKNSFLLYLA